MSQTPETSESLDSSKKTGNGSPENDTKSAEPAEVRFIPASPLSFMHEEALTKVACTTCKQVTEQFDYKIAAMPADMSKVSFDPEFMAKMGKLVRRLVFCTNCGTYRLTS